MARYMLSIFRADDNEYLLSIHLPSSPFPLWPVRSQVAWQLRRTASQFTGLPRNVQLMAHLTLAIGTTETKPVTRRPLYFRLIDQSRQTKVIVETQAHGPAVV